MCWGGDDCKPEANKDYLKWGMFLQIFLEIKFLFGRCKWKEKSLFLDIFLLM